MQKVEIILSSKEYKYLIYTLLSKHNNLLSKIKVSSSADTTKLSLDEDTAYEIRELASDEVALHFDENYTPTEEGWILEHFIDKFYFEYFFSGLASCCILFFPEYVFARKVFFSKDVFLRKMSFEKNNITFSHALENKNGCHFHSSSDTHSLYIEINFNPLAPQTPSDTP